jgi:hypothetical protein
MAITICRQLCLASISSPGSFPLRPLRLCGETQEHPTRRRTGCLAPIWAACLLASDRALHPVPGTDLGPLFASIRPGVAPGAWHRFGAPVC